MKKTNVKLFIITILAFIILPIQNSYAAEASLLANDSVTVGENINITVSMPSGAVAYSGSVTITYSDGTSNTTKISQVSNMNLDEDFNQVEDAKVSFNAKVIGNATIKVNSLAISDADNNKMNSNSTLTKNVQIYDKQTPPPTVDEDPGNVSDNTPSFEDTNETVYVSSRVNVRQSYTTSSKSYGMLDVGTAVTRTGIGSNGWSRVEYNGEIAYISSQYLTSEKPEEEEPTFTEVDETVYVRSKVNVRQSYTTNSNSYGLLEVGDEITRVGIGNNGWSKVKYNGDIAYISSNFLTKEKIEVSPTPTVSPEPTESPKPSASPTPTSEEDEKNKEEKAYKAIVKSVGVLPEVGNNISKNIYILIAVITILELIIINVKSKE